MNTHYFFPQLHPLSSFTWILVPVFLNITDTWYKNSFHQAFFLESNTKMQLKVQSLYSKIKFYGQLIY